MWGYDESAYDGYDEYGPCSLRSDGCEGTGALTEDPYQADVMNNPGVMIYACAWCLEIMCDDL